MHQGSVEIDVHVHRLDVHLVGVRTDAVVLGVVASAVLDDGLFQALQNDLEVLCVHLDAQGIDAAVGFSVDGTDLDGAVGRKVLAELTQILPIVVLNDQDGGMDVFLGPVSKGRKNLVVRVLQSFDSRNQRLLVVVELERDQRNLPVFEAEILVALARVVSARIVHVGGQRGAVKIEPRNAVVCEDLALVPDLRYAAFVPFNKVDTRSTVQVRVFRIVPERQHLVGLEELELRLVFLIEVQIDPRNAAPDGVGSGHQQAALEVAVKHLVENRLQVFVLRLESDGLAKQIAGLLIDEFRKLVVHELVVWQSLEFYRLAKLTHHRALFFAHILHTKVVGLAVELSGSHRSRQPSSELKLQKLNVRHVVFSAVLRERHGELRGEKVEDH